MNINVKQLGWQGWVDNESKKNCLGVAKTVMRRQFAYSLDDKLKLYMIFSILKMLNFNIIKASEIVGVSKSSFEMWRHQAKNCKVFDMLIQRVELCSEEEILMMFENWDQFMDSLKNPAIYTEPMNPGGVFLGILEREQIDPFKVMNLTKKQIQYIKKNGPGRPRKESKQSRPVKPKVKAEAKVEAQVISKDEVKQLLMQMMKLIEKIA